jgi:hypothetical protein
MSGLPASPVFRRRRCRRPPPLLSRAAARSSLHPSPKFFIYSLRSGEFPTKVRRAFPATSDISGEFRFPSEELA